MADIAAKLADLTQRVLDLEAQLASQGQHAPVLEVHGRTSDRPAASVAGMQKRLSSLKRSCEILAQHV